MILKGKQMEDNMDTRCSSCTDTVEDYEDRMFSEDKYAAYIAAQEGLDFEEVLKEIKEKVQ